MKAKPDRQLQQRLDYRRKLTFWYAALMLTVFLFYFDGQGYQGISQAKFQMFLLLTGLYLAAMLFLLMDQLFTGQLKGCTPLALWKRTGWSQRLMAVYLALTWLSALCSPWLPATILGASRYEGALSITLYCLIFLLASACGEADRRLLAVLGASVTLFCVLCLVQLAGFNPFGLYPEGYGYADAGRAYSGAYLGTIGNVDLTAAFLSPAFPMLLYALIRLSGRSRWALLVPVILSGLVLVRMSVLAGLVGAGAGCLLSLPAAGARRPELRRKLAFAVGGVLLAGLAAVFFVDLGGELPHQLHLLLHGQADPSFGSGRLHIWGEVLSRVPEHPLLGAGPDTMLYAGIPPFTRYDPDLGYTITARIDAAHNEYLNILYHQGIPALAAYLGALVTLAAGWLRASPEDDGAAVLGAGVLGCCAQAFFGISSPLTTPLFFLVLGLLAGRVRRPAREKI